MSSINHFKTLIAIEQHTRNFFGAWELALHRFFEFLTPSILGGRNLLNSNLFLLIFSVLDAPIRGIQVFFWDTSNFLNSNPSLMIFSAPKPPIGGVHFFWDTKNNEKPSPLIWLALSA